MKMDGNGESGENIMIVFDKHLVDFVSKLFGFQIVIITFVIPSLLIHNN